VLGKIKRTAVFLPELLAKTQVVRRCSLQVVCFVEISEGQAEFHILNKVCLDYRYRKCAVVEVYISRYEGIGIFDGSDNGIDFDAIV
jgi:hypothetical protein